MALLTTIWGNIKSFFLKKPEEEEVPEEPKIIKIINHCNICPKKINVLSGWRCAYCNEWHCDKHRLPEDHKCEGNPMSPPKIKGNPIDF